MADNEYFIRYSVEKCGKCNETVNRHAIIDASSGFIALCRLRDSLDKEYKGNLPRGYNQGKEGWCNLTIKAMNKL